MEYKEKLDIVEMALVKECMKNEILIEALEDIGTFPDFNVKECRDMANQALDEIKNI